MEYVFGLMVLALGALGYNFVKRKSAEALLENVDVKNKLNEQDKTKSKNDGLLDAEAELRKMLEAEKNKDKNKPIDPKDFN